MKKLKFVFVVIAIGYLLVLLSLFRIQFFLDNYVLEAGYIKKREIPAKRGVIYDYSGQILAGSVASYDVTIDPKYFTPSDKNLNAVLKIVNESKASYEARLKSGSPRWAKLAENLSFEGFTAMQSLGLLGFYGDERPKRVYPEASLSATLLGFVGSDRDGESIGYYGVEGYYESDLKGLPGLYAGERDLASRPMLLGFQDRLENQDGRDIYLTIDKSVQQLVKDVAKKGMELHSPKEICIVVADPSTMAILGLSCLPDYDPKEYGRFPESTYKNYTISDVYEPGSTFKPIVVAKAVDEKAIGPNDKIPEKGPVTVGDYTVSTWDYKYRGELLVKDVLAKSSNVGMVEIGKKMGNDKVYEMLMDFGFGKNTGIDLQGEVSGSVRDRDSWYPIDYATATFGQGIAVTPIQLITAFSAVINGGELLKPYVVDRISDGSNVMANAKKTVVRRVISEKTSKIMRGMLEHTVDNAEYKWAKPQGYRFGGKTGTAQIAIAGKYDAKRTIASFIGFTPVDKPKFIALVMLKEPSSSEWGSETAAPLFFDLAKSLIAYYDLKPEQ